MPVPVDISEYVFAILMLIKAIVKADMEWEVKPLSQKIKITESQRKRSGVCDARFGTAQAKRVRSYHQGFPGYAPTALRKLEHLAEYLGIAAFYVKDESTRFGLNAFKGLGGSYGIGRYIAELCEIPEEELTYERLLGDAVRKKTKGLTFVTATDGNHGRGIAWAARELGLNAVVYLPQNSAKERLFNIQRLGAGAEILELNYDDTVRFAAACEKEKGWVLVQDTAWEGYEKIPAWIMQGYMTMARICPTAMIFVPSVKGISHNPEEFTRDEDLIAGANVFLDVVSEMAVE